MMHRCLWLLVCALSLSAQDAKADPVQAALAMFESGAIDARPCAADRRRGASGEVSRYQIMPAVWRQYTRSTQHDNPSIAWSVAQRVLRDRVSWFQSATGREPKPVELYLLWNKPGHFGAARFEVGRVRSVFRKRAERFANLFDALESRPKVAFASVGQ